MRGAAWPWQDEALKQYLADKKQKQSLGQKIDVVLKAIRVCLVHGDLPQAKKHIETAHECVGARAAAGQ